MEQIHGYVDEIFLSLQGEGGEVGRPQVFLRMGGCPLRCDYCDTPESWNRKAAYPCVGADETRVRDNPVDPDRLDEELAWVAASHGMATAGLTLSVTGGEPLAQVEFLDRWLPRWPGRVMLETAGLWPDRLERLLPHLDMVSLDWKLASTVDEGRRLCDGAGCARLFAASGVEGWIKLVVTETVGEAEVEQALRALCECAPGVRVFLQPATRVAGGPAPPPSGRLLAWMLRFHELPLDLRVLPQVHPVLEIP